MTVFTPMFATMTLRRDNMRKAASRGFINATDCADYLTKKGVPFRDAYKTVGRLVNQCIKADETLETMTMRDFAAISNKFGDDVYDALDLRTCVAGRKVIGGPAPQEVTRQIDKIEKFVADVEDELYIMSKPKIYIDGKEGTTGLQIYERLGKRDDVELLLIDEDKRKDTEERRKFLNAADIVFLCLPDAAAKEAVTLIENDHTRVIDASTAHRTDPDWDYGFAELSKAHRAAIAGSRRVANPGCHASGFISSVYPLVARGVVPEDFAFTCSSLTGYSGGGKKMIAEYEDAERDTPSRLRAHLRPQPASQASARDGIRLRSDAARRFSCRL